MSATPDILPVVGVITGQSSNAPAVSGSHSYTATVNTPNGLLQEITIGRPIQEFWHNTPQLEVYPLTVGTGFIGSVIGDGTILPSYIEPPRIGPCGQASPIVGLTMLERLIVELETSPAHTRAMVAAKLKQIVEEA